MQISHWFLHGDEEGRQGGHCPRRQGKPSIFLPRLPHEDSETEMVQTIKAGEGIIAANASGNRDEEVFPDPDIFDMYRTPDPNHALGFGFGSHRCIAEALARAEMELVFGKHVFLGMFFLR